MYAAENVTQMESITNHTQLAIKTESRPKSKWKYYIKISTTDTSVMS